MQLLHRYLPLLCLSVCATVTFDLPGAEPGRLNRADSFLGIHFDFHAGPDCTEIGRNTTPEMVANIIDLVRPDYLQIDCKGHRGLSSYPTKVGNPAPGFVGDPLRIWRQVTAERGVSLYMHYSGVWDTEAINRNPSWGVINADGSTNNQATSFFSPYADKLLIPQLRELAGEYKVDGVWVDGECWASAPDWSPAALKAFRTKTGASTIPRKPGDPYWREFLDFNRELFRGYLRHYITEVKRTHPDFELCSNWAYTDHMAEPVSAPLDFFSGDYSPDDSVNSARVSARYLAQQGVPWDLMAWSFSQKQRDGDQPAQKTAVQLQREAAVVLALGGGFQAYFRQKRDGSIFPEQMPVMAEVAKFCRERQALCHRSKAVPQVALLLSTAAHYRRVNGLFPRDLSQLSGVLQALVENQYSVEIVGEHHLKGRIQEYPLIVVPEWEYLEARFRTNLLQFVRKGGNLLLVGPRSSALFAAELGISGIGEPAASTRYLAQQDVLVPVSGLAQPVKPGEKTRFTGRLHNANDSNAPALPAVVMTRVGKGRIAATTFEFGADYNRTRAEGLRYFVGDLMRDLFPHPLVEVSGSSNVDVLVARKEGKLLVNLVNTAGPHQSSGIIENIPTIGPLTVQVRHPEKPRRVTLEPGNRQVAWSYQAGQLQVIVPEVDVHDIISVEPR